MNPSSVCLLRCFLRPPHGGGFTSGLIPGAADNETCSLVEGRSLLRCRLYAVIFPSEIRVLSPQLACLHVEGASGETSVQLTLTSSNGNTSLIDKSFQLDSLFTCIPFQIPNPSEQNEEVCTINVVIKMPQETLFKQTKVLLKKERSSVVVQTDKPIYKPGQTGKHREGVSLNVKFQGMSSFPMIFNSFSQDPANNRIGQWLNVTLNEGISEFSLPLSAEPTLGDYKVWVKGKVSTFSVQEYVLPKFEIRLHLPKAVMFNQETIPVKVCDIVLGWLQTLTNPFCCLHVSFFYSLFGRILQTFHILTFSFILHAGVEMTTQSGAVIAMMLEKVSFVDADKMYRPGIPYSGTVRVTDVSSHNIVLHAITIHSLNVADLTGSTSFNFPLTPDVSPNLRVLAYILLPDGEIAADSAKFTVQRCFKNKVSVGFTPDEVLPGSDVSLQIQADPGSLCGLRVVDHSVILMKPEKELTADKKKIYPVPDRSKAVLLYPPQAAYARNPEYSICKEGANKGCFPRQPNHNKSFQCAGRYLAQGCVLKTHTCLFVSSDCHFISHCCGFLYRDSGSVVLHETAPDTITDWNAGAFCMGPSGFGLASPASLRVFQPFFVDLTLPYSVVRGESFTLKASVFNYLKEWYQRQLTYKHGDGSYSAFGKSDKEGNTWLTAFVVKSFSKARPYIFIDETHLNQSFNWLKKHRKDDGCFQTIGKLFNTALKVPCLSPPPTLYGQLHWERPSAKPTSDHPFWYRAPSAEVELTSYMLMTSLSGPEKNLGRASEIVNWLSKQQNPYGGFSSTQDTVVALHDAGDVTVTVRSQTGVQEFHVDNTNRLLLQKASLPDIPGDYTLTASGSGCVYVQTVLRYNVPPPRSDATFVIRVEVKPDQCPEEAAKKLQLNIYTEYTGPREKSNMALIEVKMLSGYIPVKISVRELEKSKVIQRSEISSDMVTLYLNEIGHKSLHLPIMVVQDIEVKNLKPATVKVFDYYETGKGVC
uniref:Uncharacterized protein n=1 Tax=Leptobrachium leishanense TaxID=445787 RepID=A0A8C5PZS9_9ANUR